MTIIPVALNDEVYSLFVILEEENLKRMKAHDPADVQLSKMTELWKNRRLKDIVLMYASDEDMRKVGELLSQAKVQEALRFLSEGFKYRPEAGDHDRNYEGPF